MSLVASRPGLQKNEWSLINHVYCQERDGAWQPHRTMERKKVALQNVLGSSKYLNVLTLNRTHSNNNALFAPDICQSMQQGQ